MSHYWNRRTGRNGSLRAEPGASASARLTLRQASHGRCRNTLLAWERGAVAYVIRSNPASVCVHVRISFLLLRYYQPLFDGTASFRCGPSFGLSSHLATSSLLFAFPAQSEGGKKKPEF
jgi:hypothetical protein